MLLIMFFHSLASFCAQPFAGRLSRPNSARFFSSLLCWNSLNSPAASQLSVWISLSRAQLSIGWRNFAAIFFASSLARLLQHTTNAIERKHTKKKSQSSQRGMPIKMEIPYFYCSPSSSVVGHFTTTIFFLLKASNSDEYYFLYTYFM